MRTNDAAPAVRFESVTKDYGPVRAVDAIDLTIERGQTVAMLGPNGAGKSTSINMLLGLFGPDSGRISVFGTTPEAASTDGRIGAMLQETRLVPRITVDELLSFVRGLYPDALSAAELVRVANLDGLGGRRLERLSGGQAQRVRFAMAIAGRPDLLVLDEPTAAMDVESRREFWASMRRYARGGHTVLFSTHYVEEADTSADRVVVIAEGRIVADGSPAELKRANGHRVVSVAVPADGTGGLELLPGVSAIEVRAEAVRLSTDDVDATVLALAQRNQLRDLDVSGAALEDAFLALVERRGTDDTQLEGASV